MDMVLFREVDIQKNVKVGCGHLEVFTRTIGPEKLRFTGKLHMYHSGLLNSWPPGVG